MRGVSRLVSGTRACAWFLAILSGCAIPAMGQEAERPLLTGDAFQRQLDTIIGIGWSDLSLRQTLQRLTERWQLAVFLDRRVDPDQVVQFESANSTLRETLRDLADSLELDVCFWDGLIYVGPRGVPDRVATLAERKYEETRELSESGRLSLPPRASLQWGMLAEPRDLIQTLAESASLQLEDLERIPHDVWWENVFPPLSWSHALTLVLAGFDLTFDIADDRNHLRIVSMPAHIVLERSYPLSAGDTARIRQLQAAYPNAQIQRSGRHIQVRGTADEHAGVQRLLQGETRSRSVGMNRVAGQRVTRGGRAEETRYTLRATNSVGAILRAIAQRSELQLEVAPDLADQLDERVTIDVEEVTLEELLERLVGERGWGYELRPPQLRIFAPGGGIR